MRYQGARLNDEERRQWVENDEGLQGICHAEMRMERISKKEWIKRNRKLIDQVAGRARGGEKRAHYLMYGSKTDIRQTPMGTRLLLELRQVELRGTAWSDGGT